MVTLTSAYGGTVLLYDIQSDPPLQPCWGNLTGILAGIFSWTRICVDSFVPFVIIVCTNYILVQSVLKSKEVTDSGQRSKVKVKYLAQSGNKKGEGSIETVSSSLDSLGDKITGIESKKLDPREHREPTRLLGIKIPARALRKRQQQKGKSERQLLIRLMLISLAFLVLTLPWLTIVAFSSFFNYRSRSIEFFANFTLARKLANLLLGMRASWNFLIYFFTGSKFRTDLKSFFLRWLKK